MKSWRGPGGPTALSSLSFQAWKLSPLGTTRPSTPPCSRCDNRPLLTIWLPSRAVDRLVLLMRQAQTPNHLMQRIASQWAEARSSAAADRKRWAFDNHFFLGVDSGPVGPLQ